MMWKCSTLWPNVRLSITIVGHLQNSVILSDYCHFIICIAMQLYFVNNVVEAHCYVFQCRQIDCEHYVAESINN